MKSGNIILFPKWQKVLEEESIAAIKDKKFEEALDKLNNLLSYQIRTHEIYTGKLICLMELERYDEAQTLCESLLEAKDIHYYQYIHIYLTLLFQTNQYDELIDRVDELESNHIPEHLKIPFDQLYKMSQKMRLNMEHERSNLYLESLYDAVHQENHSEQWRIIQQLSKMNMLPNNKVISYLTNEHVHPLIKSAIFLWMKHIGYTKPVEIHKFGIYLEKIPDETSGVEDTAVAKLVARNIHEIEQGNPSLARVMEKLLEHYLHVLYPIIPPEEDAPYIAEALLRIGNEYLNGTSPITELQMEKVDKYMQEIKTTDLLYATIAED